MRNVFIFFLILLFITGCCKKEKAYKLHFKDKKTKKHIHLQRATFYLEGGNYALAEKELIEAIKSDPNDYNDWLMLGDVYDKMNEDKKAIEAYIVGIRLKKRDEKVGSSSLRNPFKPMRKRKG